MIAAAGLSRADSLAWVIAHAQAAADDESEAGQ